MPEIAPLPYGFVVGRFLLVQGDSSLDDDRYPDAVPALGTLTLTPVAPRFLITTSPPATAIAQPVTLTIDSQGYITDPTGQRGVWVVAGQYDVTFRFNAVSHSPFKIAVATEHTVDAPLDLTLVAPLNPTPDIKFVVNEEVYTQTLAARDEAVAALANLPSQYVSLATAAKNPDLLIVGNVTRDSSQAVTSADVVWPDGTPGTFTALALSTTFPGAIDSYRITYGSPVIRTFTQPAIARNAAGAVTSVPQIVVT